MKQKCMIVILACQSGTENSIKTLKESFSYTIQNGMKLQTFITSPQSYRKFRNFREGFSFVKIELSRKEVITMSFTNVCNICPSHEFLSSQMCLLTLFPKIKFPRNFRIYSSSIKSWLIWFHTVCQASYAMLLVLVDVIVTCIHLLKVASDSKFCLLLFCLI